ITEALDLLRTAAAMIDARNQEASTPCAEWTVAQVLQHAAGDQLAWAATLGEGSGPDADPFAPSGHLERGVGDLLDPALATARSAWTKIGSGDDAVPTPLPQGELPAPVAAAACALDAAIHAWDIAAALGQPEFLSDGLATQLLPARDLIEPLRQFGAYAAALPPQPGDGPAAELLRYLGRDPQWQLS
ncbi:MAG TPA: TIGR03086 family metal-binding protein, partial [Streptosporangiaceae bacterium]|nr:TIGR03086 family metal-binding protein [Streptosporangiaceae bacterium]